jgi:hypothetical protein
MQLSHQRSIMLQSILPSVEVATDAILIELAVVADEVTADLGFAECQ